jgi:hypothetical protein
VACTMEGETVATMASKMLSTAPPRFALTNAGYPSNLTITLIFNRSIF